jgi:hypothetical protein
MSFPRLHLGRGAAVQGSRAGLPPQRSVTIWSGCSGASAGGARTSSGRHRGRLLRWTATWPPCRVAAALRGPLDAWLLKRRRPWPGVLARGDVASAAGTGDCSPADGDALQGAGQFSAAIWPASPPADRPDQDPGPQLRLRHRPACRRARRPPWRRCRSSKAEPRAVRPPVATARRIAKALGLPVPYSAICAGGAGPGRRAALEPQQRPGGSKGSWRSPSVPPTVPAGTARLRFAFTAGSHRRRDRPPGAAPICRFCRCMPADALAPAARTIAGTSTVCARWRSCRWCSTTIRVPGFGGGSSGSTVFFVISGYLIHRPA